MGKKLIVYITVAGMVLTSACTPKCATCPGMKPNKYQKQSIKMERKMDRQARKQNKN